MPANGFERKILEKMSESLVVNISELYSSFKATNKRDKAAVNMAVKALVQKDMITPVYASETTFAITQNGTRASKK